MKFLFIVHRTYPYSGGSEYNIKLITEALVNCGHKVVVLTDCGIGNYGGVEVTLDRSEIFSTNYDLIVIHGADMPTQDYALYNLHNMHVPTLYWIIKPSDSASAIIGMKNATYVGWGTSFDLQHIIKYDVEYKAVYIRYVVDLPTLIENTTFIKPRATMFLSSGGFSPHKGFVELAECFNSLKLKDTILVLTGYINSPPDNIQGENIIPIFCNTRAEYLNILAAADMYIMNSFEEGFGLVLLDAMLNKVPWISRDIAGAHDMQDYGRVYNTKEELQYSLSNYRKNAILTQAAYDYVLNCRTPKNMVNDLIQIFNNPSV